MTRTGMKAMVAKVMTVGLLAGAFAVAAAPVKAEAQQFVVSAQFGGPRYFDVRHDYYERLRIEEARRAELARLEAIRRHDEWVRMHRFHEGWR